MAEIDAVRADRGLDELRRSARLTRLARDVAADMGRNGSFSHPSNANGEALFWSSGPVSASDVVQSFLDSPLHRRITLSGQWRTIGVAAVLVQNAPGAFGGLDATIVVVEYGPSPS
jgi:uncharacterized protein YkwD